MVEKGSVMVIGEGSKNRGSRMDQSSWRKQPGSVMAKWNRTGWSRDMLFQNWMGENAVRVKNQNRMREEAAGIIGGTG